MDQERRVQKLYSSSRTNRKFQLVAGLQTPNEAIVTRTGAITSYSSKAKTRWNTSLAFRFCSITHLYSWGIGAQIMEFCRRDHAAFGVGATAPWASSTGFWR